MLNINKAVKENIYFQFVVSWFVVRIESKKGIKFFFRPFLGPKLLYELVMHSLTHRVFSRRRFQAGSDRMRITRYAF